MTDEFNRLFADFLTDRMGNALARLRNDNEKYKLLINKKDEILHKDWNDFGELKQAFSQLTEVIQEIDDIELNYIFLMGMLEYKKINDVPTSKEFYKEFLDI